MNNKFVTEGFNKITANFYDERNRKLHSINDCLHLLMRLVLSDLPSKAHVLNVGVGTGLELAALATANPGWSFVGVEPSSTMIEGARKIVEQQGLSERCSLFNGYLSEYSSEEKFDAVVCLLVMHFVRPEDRREMYRDMASRLRPGGRLMITEISVDFDHPAYSELLKNWISMQAYMGEQDVPDLAAHITKQIREQLPVVAAQETEEMIRSSGFSEPVPFFQSFFIKGWHAHKP